MHAPFRCVVLASLALLAVGIAQPAIAQSGPVAAYAFNEGAGTTTADATGNGRTGTLTSTTWTTAGRFGGALTFNGSSSRVTVADHALLDLTTGMTLEAWVYPTAAGGYRTVILKERPGELAYALYSHEDVARPAAWITAGSGASAAGTTGLPLNTWTHLAATYDGAVLRVFVNGVQVGSQAHSGSMFVSTSALRIGGNTIWGEYFAGRIDEVRIYARALSPGEIQTDMNTAVAPPVTDTTPPTAAITSPAAGAAVSGTMVVSAAASDNIAVAGVQFFIDGAAVGAEDTSSPYSITVDTRTLLNTGHLVTARARDAAGNTTLSPAVAIAVSNPPLLVITAPAPGATISGTVVPITYTTAGDMTGYGVDHVHFQIDGGPDRMDTSFDGVHQLTSIAAGPHVLTGYLARGDHTKIPGTDAVAVSFTSTVPDTEAPTVQITAPVSGTVSGAVQIDATAADNVGVVGVQFLLDGAALGAEDTTAPYTVSWPSTTAANGPHSLSARARDAAGQSTTSAAVSVTVSNTGPANLVAAYAFDEGTGTIAGDASGNGLIGTLAGTTWTTAGRYGGALTFNGTSAMVTVADHPLLDLTTGMTAEAWIYPTALTGYQTVILKERPGELAYALYAHDGAPRPSAWITAGTSGTAAGTANLPLNTWTHLATTYDGAVLRLYVNGVQVASQAHAGSLFVSTSPLRIGGNAIWGEYFTGRIDDVRLFSRALSAVEIQNTMNTPVGGPPAATWKISGSITPIAAGSGATVSVTGPTSATTTADLNGNYTLSGLGSGAYTVTSGKSGYTYSPVSRAVSIAGADVTGINFAGSETPGIRLVQNFTQGFEQSVTNISATFPVANTPGNFLIVTGTAARPAGTITISDSAGNVYVPAVGPVTEPNQDVTAYIWYVANAKGGSNTVTLTPTGPRAMEIHISEWSGVDPVSPLEQTSTGAGTGTFSSSGARTTTVNGSLVFGYAFVQHTASAGSGFTPLSLINGDLDEYQIQTIAGSVAATFTHLDGHWLAMMATFKPVVLDTTAPTVALTAPGAGTVFGSTTVSAAASDNAGVAGVQFQLDGVNLGVEDTIAPYALSWDTATAVDGPHLLTAVARDAAGNRTTSAAVAVTVANTGNPAVVGQWAQPFEMGTVAVNMALLHTGQVLYFSGTFATTGVERLWDPVTGLFTDVPLGRTNLFCAAHSQMADGRLLLIGGHDPGNGLLGSRDVNIFDPVTHSWTVGASMSDPRWYPTATTLADGRVLSVSGGTTCLTCIADVPEVYNPVTNAWTRLTAPTARLAVPYYPFMFLLPNGQVVDAGANEAAVATRSLNVATQTWTMIDPIVVDGHSAAMYRPGQIIKSGTASDSGKTGNAAATAYVIDMNQGSPAWRQIPSMAFPRAYHNTVVLPTGDVLVTGGGTRLDGWEGAFAVREAELWSPATETWRTLAPMQLPRLYHSGALLLPDARVLIAGGGNDGPSVNYTRGEIFSPPYLFKGPRPTITAAPPLTQYASSFLVDTPDAANITSVALIRPGAVTHSFDEDQRFLNLTFVREAGRLVVQAPANANVAPPGYYMLFLLTGDVPSTAVFIRLPSPAEDITPPTVPSNLSATGGIGTATVSWDASSDDTGVTAYNVHRATTSGVVPTPANRIAQTAATSYVDSLPGGTYYYVVTAEDAKGNLSPSSNQASAFVLMDVSPPTVAITSPAEGAQLSGTVTIAASAADDIGVVGVRFEIDLTPVGSEDLSAPYTFNWPTTSSSNGTHSLTAVARDAQGQQTRSAPILVTVANAQTPLGLVAAYGFDELTGSSVTDSSGNGNGGTISNAVRTAAGRFGRALQFNGTTSMVNVADAASLDLTTGMTLSAWVRPSQLGAWQTVIMKERSGGIAYAMYADNDAMRPAGFIAFPGYVSASGSAGLPVDSWTHLAVTYDGASLILFVNGIEVRRVAASGPMTTSTSMLRIGGNTVWGDEFFAGLIDEVRVYNRALTVSEIQAAMNTPVGGG